MLILKQVTGPTLDGSGRFTQEFGEGVNIRSAVVLFTNPFTGSAVGPTATLIRQSWSISGNLLTVTIEKSIYAPSAWGAWQVAITSDLANQTVAMLADIE